MERDRTGTLAVRQLDDPPNRRTAEPRTAELPSRRAAEPPSRRAAMRIATWNVNGIRARAAQVRDWLERERPDVVCLQELKAEIGQLPGECRLPDYYEYWHCLKGYSGVSLQVRKGLFAAEPVFSHPPFDREARIVQADAGDLAIASVYVPNGGKDYDAKLAFLRQLADWAARLRADGRELLLCGDLNVARTDLDVHPKERKDLDRRGTHRPGPPVRPRQPRPLHLVGAVAEPQGAEHRLAD